MPASLPVLGAGNAKGQKSPSSEATLRLRLIQALVPIPRTGH